MLKVKQIYDNYNTDTNAMEIELNEDGTQKLILKNVEIKDTEDAAKTIGYKCELTIKDETTNAEVIANLEYANLQKINSIINLLNLQYNRNIKTLV